MSGAVAGGAEAGGKAAAGKAAMSASGAGRAAGGAAVTNVPKAGRAAARPAAPVDDTSAGRNAVIEMENVKRIYTMGDQEVHALRGISFTIREGEFVSIMGPSGSGKSTCMNMIGCLDRPTAGIVKINGKETAKMDEKELAYLRNRTVGFVFQQYFLLNSMSVLENVMLPLRYQGIAKRQRQEMAMQALEKVGLAERVGHHPYELSGGQKQRVAIARATVTRPKIILADEPTGALDSATGKAVLKLFYRINRTEGTTVVIVTHDPRIGSITNRCIHILDGSIKSDMRRRMEAAK